MTTRGPFAVTPLGKVACGSLLARVGRDLSAVVIAKATFALTHDGPAWVVDPAPLVEVDVHRGGDPRASLVAASDLVPYLPGAGVTLTGSARVAVGAASGMAALAIYGEHGLAFAKSVHVLGPPGGPAVPLVYERAFGGAACAENPCGVGAEAGPTRPTIVGTSDPRAPAGFGPIAATWEPRRSRLRAAPIGAEAGVAIFGDGFPWDALHAAPLDQRMGYLRGDERIALQGFHAPGAWTHARLPGARAMARFDGPQARRGQDITLVADTLVLDADRMSASVTWRGHVAVRSLDEAAALRVLVAIELPSAPAAWPVASTTPETKRTPSPPVGTGDLDPAALDAVLPKGWRQMSLAGQPLPAKGPDTLAPRPSAAAEALPFIERSPPFPVPPAVVEHALRASTDAATDALPEAAAATMEPTGDVRVDAVAYARAGVPLIDLALAGADLSGLDLANADLRRMNLEGTRFVGARLVSADLAEARLVGADLTGASCNDADFSLADLSRAELGGATLDGATLGRARLGGVRAAGVSFARVHAEGASFARAALDGASFSTAGLRRADFSGAALAGADFTNAALDEARLCGASGQAATFDGADLARADLGSAALAGASFKLAAASASTWDGATLDGAAFASANLRGASWYRASAASIDAEGADLRGANLQRVTAEGASFVGANLDGADLRQAQLGEASFEGASLRSAHAARADFTKARLAKADLAGGRFREATFADADLSSARLDRADLREVTFDRATLTGATHPDADVRGARGLVIALKA